MRVLQLPFKLLTITGIWMPIDWTLKHQQPLWILFSILCIGLVLVQFSSQVSYMLLADNWAQFNERLFFVPTGVSSLQKIYIFITHRKELINLGEMFLREYCVPRNAEELIIQERYNETIRVVTLACAVLVNITMMNLVSLPFVTNAGNRTLPMEVWLPYSIESNLLYWFSYCHQTLGIFMVGTGAVGSTLMVNGFMYQLCAQFEILSHRFHRLPQVIEKFQSLKKPYHLIYKYEKHAIRQNVRHHLYIFRLADIINKIFKSVIFQQFCMSAIVVSASIYQLTTRPEINLEFIMVLFYLICVLTEFLVYCWFGNELMLESLSFRDSVYSIDWTMLSADTGRDLVFVMLRASKPILMYCGHFIVLSLETYIGVLKVSYSVFNILRESSD